METTLECFAEKISESLKSDDSILLKMQEAQHEHDRKMFIMLTQYLDRASQAQQPPFYQVPMQPSQPYTPQHPPSQHSTLYPSSLQFNNTSTHTTSVLQELSQPLPYNTPAYTQSFGHPSANSEEQCTFFSQHHSSPYPSDKE